MQRKLNKKELLIGASESECFRDHKSAKYIISISTRSFSKLKKKPFRKVTVGNLKAYFHLIGINILRHI